MSERVVVGGGRELRGVLDTPDGTTVVVACPPHPQMGGSKSDPRLQAVSDGLAERSIACLRFDYGPWDDGRGEIEDVGRALDWARDRFDRIGVFGYSFGGWAALLAAAESDPVAVAVLAPAASIGDRRSVAAIADIDCPLLVCYGERDETVDWERVVEAAEERGASVEGIGADHHFVGQRDRVGDRMGAWFAERLQE